MVLRHGIQDFPECAGQAVTCGGCGATMHLNDCISVVWLKQLSETQGQIQMSLSCTACVIERIEPLGRC